MNKLKENSWHSIKIDTSTEPDLTENARVVLEKRYLMKDETGKSVESPKHMFERVAKYIASAEYNYNKSQDEINTIAQNFYEIIASQAFIPNSPTLMNAGRPLGQLSACFVIPVPDSMDEIFEALKNMALIHKSGGGTGFSFSNLRPKNDTVKSTTGVSSGPVSFMNIFNSATETVKQGGTRRGANMAILRVDHPDILEFITAKEDTSALTNFNISVALTDEFMTALENDKEYSLINPRSGKETAKLKAKEVYTVILKKAWQNGEPGIIFIDRINDENPLKKIGTIESTNPCGEQPLMPYESCNLGSINLNKVLKTETGKTEIDYSKLRSITETSVRFLDNVVDLNKYPLEEIKKTTQANRKIGLGVMGFADVCIALEIPYNSEKAVKLAESIMSTIQDETKNTSIFLAKEKGAFPNFKDSTYAEENQNEIRNATTTTIAPTGTISIIANASGGVEPVFALAYARNVMDNDILIESNPQFVAYAKKHGFYSEELMKKVAEEGSIAHIDEVPDSAKKIFVTAHDIAPEWHIKIQAAFQKYVDNAVSKTVNFANEATVEDIEKVYSLAYHLGCKGVTVYRDGSRDMQVLSTQKTQSNETNSETGQHESIQQQVSPRPRSELTVGSTRKMLTGCGSLYVTINEDENGLFEIFATMGKSGGCAASQTEAVSRLISLALRSGIDKTQIVKQIKGVRCPNQAWEKGGKIYSCADAIAKALERHIGIDSQLVEKPESIKADAGDKDEGGDYVMVGVCPDCHGPLEFESGCSVCRACGFSRCG